MSHYYKLLDWIDINKLDWDGLSKNPGAINLLEKNTDNIELIGLSMNPGAIHLISKALEKDPEKIIRVLNHITNNLLNENGTLIITLPINQNESTDNFIYTNNLFENYNILERKSLIFNTWHEIKFQDIKGKYQKKPLFIKHIYIVKLCNGNCS